MQVMGRTGPAGRDPVVPRLRPSPRVTPNLFGIPFGLCGLAQCWSLADSLITAPSWPASALWVGAGLLWLCILVIYLVNNGAAGRLRGELADPTFGPFTALVVIVPMLLGTALVEVDRTTGVTVFLVALVLTVAVGGWLAGEWIVAGSHLEQWHPGYFLPTVAGGLVGAAGAASLGYDGLARLMFGYGMVCWFFLGSIIWLRLFTQPAMPVPLLPTLAIELAPPVVATTAWFGLNGSRADAVALGLAGYAVLMVIVQLRLVPIYRRVPFGPGWWAFSFSYAAAVAAALQWMAVQQVPQQEALTYALLLVATSGMTALAIPTVRRLAHGTFLPRPPASATSPPRPPSHGEAYAPPQ